MQDAAVVYPAFLCLTNRLGLLQILMIFSGRLLLLIIVVSPERSGISSLRWISDLEQSIFLSTNLTKILLVNLWLAGAMMSSVDDVGCDSALLVK